MALFVPQGHLPYCCAKRHQRQLCHFEALYSERNTDNRTTQKQSIQQRHQCQRDTADKQPQDIGNRGHSTAAIIHIFSKREESK